MTIHVKLRRLESFGVVRAGRYEAHDVRGGVVQSTIWNGYPCWGCHACGFVGLTVMMAEWRRKKWSF